MAVAPRLARFTSKSESSDYVNNLSFNRLAGDEILPEVPGSIANFSFDPAGNVGFLFADLLGPLPAARVQLWSDLNSNGIIDNLNNDGVVDPGDDVPFVPNALLTALTWEQVVSASNNGANDVILAIDDDGNVSDGDFNDLVVAGDIERETPPDEDCLVSEVKFTTVYEESGYFNSLSIAGNETIAGDTPVTEVIGDTATIRFDALDNTPGDFFLNTGNDGSASRVKLFVDSNNNDLYDFGVDAAIPGSEKLVNKLTWKDLADAWHNNGKKDLLVAIDDDGNSSDGDFNDIVLLAQFTEPDCKDECKVTEATFTTVYEESSYFNTIQIKRGDTLLDAIDETDGDTAVVSFDGSETFSLLTGNDGLAAAVKLFFDTNANGEYDFGTDEFVAGSQQLLSGLSWGDLLGASANGTKDLFIAVDDDGNSSDGDFNDIVLLAQFTPPDCKEECEVTEATLTTVYEESGYFNTVQIKRGDTLLDAIDETDGDTAVVSFDGTETFSLLTGNDGLAAAVKLFFDTNANGEYDFGTDEFVVGSQQLLSELSWGDLLGASANGTKDLFIAVDDDGNSSDGDFNDIVLLFRATPCDDVFA